MSALCTGCVCLLFVAILTKAGLPSSLSILFTTGRESLSPSSALGGRSPIFGQVVGPPVGEGDQDGDEGVAPAGEVVFHLGRVFPADDEAVALQLLELGGEHLVGDAGAGPLPFAVSQRPLPAEAEGDGLFSSPPQ